MRFTKVIFLLIGIQLLACQSEKTNFGKRERNIIEESMNKLIVESHEKDFVGKVKSSLEYEFSAADSTDNFIKLEESKYKLISADDSIDEIRNVSIRESNSHLFDKSGKLIKDIRFVEHDDIYMEDIEQYIFAKDGKLLEWNGSDFDKKLDAQKIFKYNSHGKLIEKNEFHFYDSLVSKMKILYYKDTIQLEEITTKRKDTTYIWQSKYNKYGELIDEELGVKKEFDENGNLSKAIYEGIEGKISSFSIVYDYDANGNKVRETEYDSTNSVIEIKMYYYNQLNELIQEIEIDSSGTDIRRFEKSGYTYEYTSTPFTEKESRFYGFWRNEDKYKNEIKRIVIQKDDKGMLIEDIRRTEIEYDNIGNWTSKRIFRNDSLTIMCDRIIKYY